MAVTTAAASKSARARMATAIRGQKVALYVDTRGKRKKRKIRAEKREGGEDA